MDSTSAIFVLVAVGLVSSALLLDRLSARRGDRLIRAFAFTFLLLGIAYGASALFSFPPEWEWFTHFVRLVALIALIGTILRTNLVR